MKVIVVGWMALALMATATGCSRISTQVVEKPRVDQDLSPQVGNRGYLRGTAPAPGSRRETRQMVETNIELPTAGELNPWRIKKAGSTAPAAVSRQTEGPVYEPEPIREEPVERSFEAEEVVEPEAPASYKVRAGDTLEKISAQVYGDASQWRRIYNANREKLSTPNRIYPGQTLTIPARQAKVQSQETSSVYK